MKITTPSIVMFLLAAAIVSTAAGQSSPQPAPTQMMSARAHDRTLVARRLPQTGSELRVQQGETAFVVPVPYEPITGAAALGQDLIVTGVLPSGLGEYRAIARQADAWSITATGVAIPGTYAIRMSYGDGLLAMLLADGRVVAASSSGADDLPSWADFDLVGHVSPQLVQMRSVAGFHVTSSRRIEVYGHPSHRPAFELGASGQWQFVEASARGRPVMSVDKPARIGGVVRFYSPVAGPVFFESEGAVSGLMVADNPQATFGELPSTLTESLKADRRYRLRANGVEGEWFFPAAITGTAWQAAGLVLQECRVWEGGVRAERGAVPFRATLEAQSGFAADRVYKIALLATTASPTPPTSVRNGHVWLNPEKALVADKALTGNRRAHVFAVPVPLPADRQSLDKWLHFQLVLQGPDGVVLGATGVRSVAVLPDKGDYTAAQEASGRAHAESYWQTNQVSDVEQFWERLVSR